MQNTGFPASDIPNQYDSYSIFPQQFDNWEFPSNDFETQGDPHPSVFRNQNPQSRVKIPKDNNVERTRVGSWDPKFLQKGKMKKFQHNNGLGYTQGLPSNCQNMKKSSGYTKVKRKKEKGQNKQINQNIFTQAFGGSPAEIQPHDIPPVPHNAIPYVDVREPPKTAKFDTFKQNLPKTK